MMQNNIILGITGEIASGKSSVSKLLEDIGFLVIDCDNINKQVQMSGNPAYFEVVEYFGEEILYDNKAINRLRLGEIVFSDVNKLNKLMEITHKYICNEVKCIIEELENTKIVIDAVLLFESGLNELCNQTWYIEADKDIRLKRLMARNNFTQEQALTRINAQTIHNNKQLVNKIIFNNGNTEELKEQVLRYIGEFSGS